MPKATLLDGGGTGYASRPPEQQRTTMDMAPEQDQNTSTVLHPDHVRRVARETTSLLHGAGRNAVLAIAGVSASSAVLFWRFGKSEAITAIVAGQWVNLAPVRPKELCSVRRFGAPSGRGC